MKAEPERSRRTEILRLAAWAGLGAFLMGAAACAKSLNYMVNPDFSVNLIRPGVAWPKLNNMTPAKLEAYNQFGKPDYFRVWYNSRGDIANSRQAGPLIRAKEVGRLPWSWVYEKEKIEIRFPSPTKFEKVPLSDKLQVLCSHGDPQAPPDVQRLKSGAIRESWIYYDAGRKFVFIDDKLADVQIFRGLGSGLRGL